jgi:hypothetical protein
LITSNRIFLFMMIIRNTREKMCWNHPVNSNLEGKFSLLNCKQINLNWMIKSLKDSPSILWSVSSWSQTLS